MLKKKMTSGIKALTVPLKSERSAALEQQEQDMFRQAIEPPNKGHTFRWHYPHKKQVQQFQIAISLVIPWHFSLWEEVEPTLSPLRSGRTPFPPRSNGTYSSFP